LWPVQTGRPGAEKTGNRLVFCRWPSGIFRAAPRPAVALNRSLQSSAAPIGRSRIRPRNCCCLRG